VAALSLRHPRRVFLGSRLCLASFSGLCCISQSFFCRSADPTYFVGVVA